MTPNELAERRVAATLLNAVAAQSLRDAASTSVA